MSRTTDEYIRKVSAQHRGKPRFEATLHATLRPFADLQQFLLSLLREFDLDTAVGVQLDAVGLWAGITRNIKTPLTGVYFSFDTPGLGFDEGAWKGPFDAETGLTVLSDDAFRTLIRARIAANSWDGRGVSAVEVLQFVFPSNTIVVEDRQDMSILIGIPGPVLDAVSRALLREEYIGLKPGGVRVDTRVSGIGGALFAFDVETGPSLAGFDAGGWAVRA